MSREIIVLTDVKLITCVVQRGQGEAVFRAAQAVGAQGATLFYARGTGIQERLGLLGITVSTEKEVVLMVVSSDQAERIFEHVYLVAELDKPGRGFMYVTHLEKAATYVPHSVIEQITATATAHQDGEV